MIEDVIKNVRESFLNEGVDEQVLQELKQVRVLVISKTMRELAVLFSYLSVMQKYKWQL